MLSPYSLLLLQDFAFLYALLLLCSMYCCRFGLSSPLVQMATTVYSTVTAALDEEVLAEHFALLYQSVGFHCSTAPQMIEQMHMWAGLQHNAQMRCCPHPAWRTRLSSLAPLCQGFASETQ